MIKRNSTAERMKLAQEILKAMIKQNLQLNEMVMFGIYTNIRNPYLMKQAAAPDMETLFVASGILTHEEYKLFSGQDENTGIDLTPGSVPRPAPSEEERPPRDESIS